MKISNAGLQLIKNYEGYKATPYICAGGKATIGYGHVISNDLHIPDEWNRTLSASEIDALLRFDLVRFERGVLRYSAVLLNTNRFSAMVAFTFNLGLGTYQRSTLRQKLNRGDYSGASMELFKYIKANGKVLKGLVRRRQAEYNLFTRPITPD